jgi:hypothetical protein
MMVVQHIKVYGRGHGNMFKDCLRTMNSTFATVMNGLVLWLDGKYFTNIPTTSLWLDRVKSNSINYTNMVINGDFSNGIAGWSSNGALLSATNNELSFTASINKGRANKSLVYTVGDKIYRSAYVKTTSNLVGIGRSTSLYALHTGSGAYERLSAVTVADTSMFLSIIDNRTSGWDVVYTKEVLAINLTVLFGVGNEPTKSECDMLFSFVTSTSTAVALRGNNATPGFFTYTTASGSDGNGWVIFDGVNDRATIINSATLALGSGDFSIGVTVKFNSSAVSQTLLCKRTSSTSNYEFNLFYNGTTDISFCYTTDGTTQIVKTFPFVPVVGTVYDFVVQRVGNNLYLYVNNAQNTTVNTISGTIFASTANMTIGTADNLVFLNGGVKRILQYNRSLSIDERTNNYNAIK